MHAIEDNLPELVALSGPRPGASMGDKSRIVDLLPVYSSDG
ncbi:hypothetical protein [Lysobacter sp. F60174L2]